MVSLAAGATGCTAIADRVATRLTDRALSKVEHEVTVINGDIALFRQCLESRGGTCEGDASAALPQSRQATAQAAPLRAGLSAPVAASVNTLEPDHPAQAASAVLSHPFLQKMAAVHNQLRGFGSQSQVKGVEVASTGSADAQETTLTLNTSPEEVSDFVDQVNQATASGAWRALAEQTGKSEGAASAGARQDARTAAFIRRYTDAYFENGKFVKVELDTQDLDTKIESYLTRDVSLFCGDPAQAKQCDALVTSLQNEILKGVAKDPANQDYILLALGTKGYVSRTGQSFVFPGVRLTLDPDGARPASVAKIDLTAVGTIGNVNEKDFQDINSFSNQVGAAVGTAFDKVIRGLGPFSLNNEALEELLTAIVTVTVHDAAQKGSWCWFSCNLDQQIEKAAADEKAKIRSDLSKSAKRIKLRLRML